MSFSFENSGFRCSSNAGIVSRVSRQMLNLWIICKASCSSDDMGTAVGLPENGLPGDIVGLDFLIDREQLKILERRTPGVKFGL